MASEKYIPLEVFASGTYSDSEAAGSSGASADWRGSPSALTARRLREPTIVAHSSSTSKLNTTVDDSNSGNGSPSETALSDVEDPGLDQGPGAGSPGMFGWLLGRRAAGDYARLDGPAAGEPGPYRRRESEPIWTRRSLALPMALFAVMGLIALVVSTAAWIRGRGDNLAPPVDEQLFPFTVDRAGLGGSQYALRLIHTNDVHARFLPHDAAGDDCDPAAAAAGGRCVGGAAYAKAVVDHLRGGAGTGGVDGSLLLNAGDEFQGSIFHALFRGNVSAQMLNAFHFDAITLGNHEFDLGPDHLARYLQMVDAPAVCANLDFTRGHAELRAAVQPFTVIERHRVGIIGVLTPETMASSNMGVGVQLTDPLAAVNAARARLAKMGINRIILLSHLGYGPDKELAARVDPGISLIIGGHTHTYLGNATAKEPVAPLGPYPTWIANAASSEWQTAIVQAKALGEYVGYMDLVFNDDGSLDSRLSRGEPVRLDVVGADSRIKGLAPSRQIVDVLRPFAEQVDHFRHQRIGTAADDFPAPTGNHDHAEYALGNLVTDAMAWAGKGASVIALLGTGAIRHRIAKGDITRGLLMDVLPYDDSLVAINVTGSAIRAMVEGSLVGSRNNQPMLTTLQVSGLRWTGTNSPAIDVRTAVANYDQRPFSGETWATLDDKQTYSLLTSGFIADGGDNHLDPVAQQTTVAADLRNPIELYITRFSPVAPALDHRK
ncbi:hypothetical protein IWQ56_000081 [Coemansia nantahalensis]|nr:hypothetical protein IWQ56_000081 [Coemansia nantahalensis]